MAEGTVEFEDAASAARVALPDDVIRTAVDRLQAAALDEVRRTAADGAAEATGLGLRASPEGLSGDGTRHGALVAAARRAQADAIVCGTRGHSGVARVVLGSVSRSLVDHAGMPVLVVPAQPDPVEGGGGPVLVAFDDSEHSAAAVAAAGRLLGGREAVVLHVWRSLIRHSVGGRAFARAPLDDVRETVAEFDAMCERWAGETAERGVALARDAGLDARALVVESRGAVAGTVLAVADREDAAAIVVGRRGRGSLASTVLGSVTYAVLHGAGRPVLARVLGH